MGYAQGSAYAPGAIYYSSSWTDAYTPTTVASLGYSDDYYVWNTKAGANFTGGSGTWSTADTAIYWADVNSDSRVKWTDGKNAVFYATPSGTATVSVSGVVDFKQIVFAASNYVISGTGTLVPNSATDGVIEVTGANTATISAVIAGKSGVTNANNIKKTGSGILTLSGTNTYTGTTTISAGTLKVTKSAALGGGNTNTTSASRIDNNAILEFAITDTATLYKYIAGAGKLIKSGAGELFLAGAGTTTARKVVDSLTVTDGTLYVEARTTNQTSTNQVLNVGKYFSLSNNKTLKVDLGFASETPRFGATANVTLGTGTTLNIIAATIPEVLEATKYVLFGKAPTSGTFANIQINGVAWTQTDSIYVDYTDGVAIVVKPKGGTPPQPTEYTVTFNQNYTGAPANTTALTVGGKLASLPTPTRTGFTLDGWYTAETGGTQVTTSTPFSANGTIYARWTPVVTGTTYTVTFNYNYTGAPAATTATAGADGKIPTSSWPANPTRDDHTFGGWFYTTTATGAAVTSAATFTENTTLYAKWTPVVVPPGGDTYTVTFNPNGGTVSPTTATTGADGKIPTSSWPANPTRDDHTFGGWFYTTTATGTEVTSSEVFTKDTTLYAKWTPVSTPGTTYTLTVSAVPSEAGVDFTCSSSGPGTATGCLPEYASETEITLTAVKKNNNYEFAGWRVNGVDAGSENPLKITMDGNKAVIANFDEVSIGISIDKAVYVPATRMFEVEFNLEEATTNYYIYELMLGGDTAAALIKPKARSGTKTEFSILADTVRMRFDTVFTIRVSTMASESGTPSPPASKNIDVGAFDVQVVEVVGNGDNLNNVVSADNGRFVLDTRKSWSKCESNNCYADSVRVELTSVPDTVSDDFIVLSKDYRFKANAKIISSYTLTTPFDISMKVDESKLTSGYGIGDVRLYRWDYAEKKWHVVFGSESSDGYITGRGFELVWERTDFAVTVDTGAYRLMINKKTPAVTISTGTGGPYGDGAERKTGYYKIWQSQGDTAITPGLTTIAVSGIAIESNIANTTAKVLYAAANATSVGDLKTLSGSLKVDGTKEDINISSNNIEIGNQSGVLVYLIINNGSVSDTINMSRRVKLNDSYTTSQNYTMWSPLAARADLKVKTIDQAFKGELFPDEEDDAALPIDDKRYRLFRYLGDGWVEYKADTKKYFEMANGRLMWLRTSSRKNFSFPDTAISASLTETFTVVDTLKSKQWTDIMMPFYFGVRVRDILEASSGFRNNGDLKNSDSLHFWTWDEGPSGYSGKRLYVWNTDDPDTVLSGPFTVYNYHGRPIELRIPPKPAFLSAKPAGEQSKKANPLSKAAEGSGFWYYAINAGLTDAHNLASLRLGYYSAERLAPAPPTLGSQSVVILSDDGELQIGDYLTPEISKGGRTFKLRFINGDRQKATFKFSAAASAGVPEKMQIMFVDAVTGEILGGSSSERSITVAAKSHSDVYAVVGSRDYLNKTAVGPTGAKFAMGGIAVNQAARSVRIKYYVPLAGTDRVEVSVYNLKGRLLWKNAEKVRLSSWNVMEWRARESRGGAVAAGLYIIRVRAINVTGKTTAVENRRITFAR